MDEKFRLLDIHRNIEKIVPVDGISPTNEDDPTAWNIIWRDGTTQQQKDDVAAYLATLNVNEPTVPDYVTRYQFKRAVLDSGQLDALKGAYAGLSAEAKLYWDESDSIGRNSVLITELQAALGFGDNAVDTFFKNAAKIVP